MAWALQAVPLGQALRLAWLPAQPVRPVELLLLRRLLKEIRPWELPRGGTGCEVRGCRLRDRVGIVYRSGQPVSCSSHRTQDETAAMGLTHFQAGMLFNTTASANAGNMKSD